MGDRSPPYTGLVSGGFNSGHKRGWYVRSIAGLAFRIGMGAPVIYGGVGVGKSGEKNAFIGIEAAVRPPMDIGFRGES